MLPNGFSQTSLRRRIASSEESIQCVTRNCKDRLMMCLSQTQMYFYDFQEEAVFLSSSAVTGASLSDDTAQNALWHPRRDDLLVVLTFRRMLFYKVPFNDGPSPDAVQLVNELSFETGLSSCVCNVNTTTLAACSVSGSLVLVHWESYKTLTLNSANLSSRLFGDAEAPVEEAATGAEEAAASELPIQLSFGVIRRISGAANGVPSDSERRRGDTRPKRHSLSGTVSSVSTCPVSFVTALVLTGGEVVLTRFTSFKGLPGPQDALRGSVSLVPSAKLAAVNGSRQLCAISTHSGSVLCFKYTRTNLALEKSSWWSNAKLAEINPGGSSPVTALAWCGGGQDLCCVGYYGVGVKVLHYSGVCFLFSSRSEAPPRSPSWLGSSAQRLLLESSAKGCVNSCWSSDGLQLSVVEPNTHRILHFSFVRYVASSVFGPFYGYFSSFALIGGDKVLVQGGGGERYPTAVAIPEAFRDTVYPVKYGSISASGEAIACAGTGGCCVYNRRCEKWLLCNLETNTYCILSDPAWLSNYCLVLPVWDRASGKFSVLFVDVRENRLLSSIGLGREPQKVYSSYGVHANCGIVCVLDVSQQIHVYQSELNCSVEHQETSDLSLQLICKMQLGYHLSFPLSIVPFFDTWQSVGAQQSGAVKLLVLCSDQSVVMVHTNELHSTANVVVEEERAPCTTLQRGEGAPLLANAAWIDNTSPLRGITFLSYEGEQIFLNHIQPSGISSRQSTVTPHRFLVSSTTDGDVVPLSISPYDAFLIGVSGRGSDVEQLSVYSNQHDLPTMRLECRRVPYGPRVLSAVLQSAMPDTTGAVSPGQLSAFVWDRKLFYWMEKLREVNLFVPCMDSFLQSAITENPPAGVRNMDRKKCILATIELLRCYPEVHKILVRCVRKVDPCRWGLVLDFIGTPLHFFQECLQNGRLEEAMHLARVLVMYEFGIDTVAEKDGSEALPEQDTVDLTTNSSLTEILELFRLAIENNSFEIAYDLFRFVILINDGCTIPTASDHSSTEVRLTPSADDTEETDQLYTPLLKLSAGHLPPPERELYQQMLEKYSVVCEVIEAHAKSLFLDGFLVQLCQLLQLFSFSVPHFVQSSQKEETDDALCVERRVCTVLVSIQTELGLLAPPGKATLRFVSAVTSYREEEQTLLKSSSQGSWTSAQCVLFNNTPMLRTAMRLQSLFSCDTVCKLAFHFLFMNKMSIMEWLLSNSMVVNKVDRSIMLKGLALLEHIVERRELEGYSAFVHDIISSLPPSLFKDK
ncbi:hypothetical protein AGDE_14737 [Angomonas deanei]|nr:hypothetical protein AGDE_14737 [Angomonas deanei]|eukprot:EPY20322.1 hypothetical protein AGDE_14737 [Angomonas deanei]